MGVFFTAEVLAAVVLRATDFLVAAGFELPDVAPVDGPAAVVVLVVLTALRMMSLADFTAALAKSDAMCVA